MEAPKQIPCTPLEREDPKNINYIEELLINQANKNYKIQFGINESSNIPNQMILKVTLVDLKYIYFQNLFDLNQLQAISKIFSLYDNIKEVISFLKTLKYEIQEKDENLILKFNVFLPNGQNKLIELILQKKFLESNAIINALMEENKSLKEDISKNKNEIALLKEQISKNQNDISILINQNKN